MKKYSDNGSHKWHPRELYGTTFHKMFESYQSDTVFKPHGKQIPKQIYLVVAK